MVKLLGRLTTSDLQRDFQRMIGYPYAMKFSVSKDKLLEGLSTVVLSALKTSTPAAPQTSGELTRRSISNRAFTAGLG